jgi:hypothetical protein
MSDSLTNKLALEEFKQMREDLRKREEAMHQILTFTTTAFTALLATASAFIFQHPEAHSIVYSYVFLIVQSVLIFGLAMMASHRDDVYRIGYYIMVFYEERYGGAEWHIHLTKLREVATDESLDPVTLIFWSLFMVSSAIFLLSLNYHNNSIVLNAPWLVVTGLWLRCQTNEFHKDRSYIKAHWVSVRDSFPRDKSL